MNNKGADQTAQMRRLVCACVVRKLPKTGFLESRPKWYRYFNIAMLRIAYVLGTLVIHKHILLLFHEKLKMYSKCLKNFEHFSISVLKYCKFRNICENFIFLNSVKRHICDIKIRDWHVLPSTVNDRVISPGFYFYMRSFAKRKPSRKFLNLQKMLLRAGTHKLLIRMANSLIGVCTVCLGCLGRQLVFEIANWGDADQTASDCFFRSSLIWVSTVCLGCFGRQLVFKILEHLQ